jgi:hypothetical protein
MIDTTNCVANADASVRTRGADDDKREVIQGLYRRGFTVEEIAEKTYRGTIPSLDENGQPHPHEMRDGRFGDETSYAKAVARWFAWCDTVARYCGVGASG